MKRESKLYKYPIGAYFYKYENLKPIYDNEEIKEPELILLRLYKVKSKNTFLLKDKQMNKVVLSKKQLEEFSMLEPDGLIIHTLASDPYQGVDTLCLLYRMKDIDDDVSYPYAVCRQNIIDPFETLLNNDPNTIYVGVSISKDTAPADFDYKSVCMASGIRDQRINFVYKDDKLEDLMSFINEEIYDKTLKIISDYMSDSDEAKYKGFVNSYRSLLIDNDFMYDFKRAFDIIRLNLTIDTSINSWTDEGIYKISLNEIYILESLTKHQVVDPILIKYDMTIDLSEIKRSYILFEDLNKELYIVSYDKGEYVNKIYSDDQKDRELLQRVTRK